MSQQLESVEEELARRHRAAVKMIYGVLTLVLVLVAISLSGKLPGVGDYDPTIDLTLRVIIIFFGLGAVALRRARFAAPRLQAIAALRGPSGLLETLHQTTAHVSLIAAAIALLGFALTIVRQGEQISSMIWIGLIAGAVLLYAYPRRTAWRRVVQLTRQDDAAGQPPATGTLT